MKENYSSFTAYSKLRQNIDKATELLSLRHHQHMQCRVGCDLCCMNYSILPLEFHYILQQLKKENFSINTSQRKGENDTCIFLCNHTCSIYKHRPVICRTHGLPLLYTNDDYEWELSTCELNFREYNYEDFSPENTFPQDTFNSKLFLLNKEFIAEFKEKEYGEYERIPLYKLAEQL